MAKTGIESSKRDQAFLRIFAKKHEMAIPSFFKQNKPRGFNYKPRYYDPVKEEWEERRRAKGMESSSSKAAGDKSESLGQENQGTEKRVYRSRIMRGSMRGRFARSRDRIKQQSTIRLIVILLIITFIVYIYLRF